MKKAGTAKRAQETRKGFTKKIGNTIYDVSFHYSRQSRESMDDKIIRLIENDMQDIKLAVTVHGSAVCPSPAFHPFFCIVLDGGFT